MIVVEKKLIKNREFYYTYSDQNKMIKDVEYDNYYNSAYDVEKREYVETDIDIPKEEEAEKNA